MEVLSEEYRRRDDIFIGKKVLTLKYRPVQRRPFHPFDSGRRLRQQKVIGIVIRLQLAAACQKHHPCHQEKGSMKYYFSVHNGIFYNNCRLNARWHL
jgi:hypothetical protein